MSPAFPDESQARRGPEVFGVRRASLFVLLLAALTGPAAAQPRPEWKLDPRSRSAFEPSGSPTRPGATGADESPVLEGFLEWTGDRPALEARGVRIQTRVGAFHTVRIGRDSLRSLLADPRLRAFTSARPVRPLLQVSGLRIGSGLQHHPLRPGAPALTGRGVLLGFVDSGLDLSHEDFHSPAGLSRVVSVWDQTDAPGPAPAGYDYGTVWGEAEIQAGRSRERDPRGHGTHVAGIAGGNGRATGGNWPPGRYVGVAPEADLAMVRINPFEELALQDTRVVDGAAWLFQLAASRGQDCVVNLSLGSSWGPHDGSTPMERMLTAMSGPGRIVVVSAGNEGGRRIHQSASGERARRLSFQLEPDSLDPGLASGTDAFLLEGWMSVGAHPGVSVRGPSGVRVGPLAPGMDSVAITPDGRVELRCTTDPRALTDADSLTGRGGPWFLLRLQGASLAQQPRRGVWQLEVVGLKPSERVDLYHTGLAAGVGMVPIAGAEDLDGLLTVPSTCDSCLCVGSFVTLSHWQTREGEPGGYLVELQPGTLSAFSSRGPTRLGALKPDLVAPGEGIASSLSHDRALSTPELRARVVEDGEHVVLEGTSMAAPQVSGATALLLQARPHLGPGAVRRVLRAAADRSGLGGDWDAGNGAGRLDVRRLLEVAELELAGGPAGLALRHATDPGGVGAWFALRVPAATSGVLEFFSVDGGRRQVLELGQLQPGLQHVHWMPAAGKFPRGVYLVRLTTPLGQALDRVVAMHP